MSNITQSEKILKRFKRGALALHRYDIAHAKAQTLWTQAMLDLKGKTSCGICFSKDTCVNGTPRIRIQMPLADYLTAYPNEKPQQRTWEYDGKALACMEYPAKFVGCSGKLEVWASARTDSAVIASPTTESAAA